MAAKTQKRSERRHEQLTLDVVRQFRLIFGSVRHHFRHVEASCGVSGSQLWVIREVSASPGVGVSALALKLSLHQSTCSQLVEALVERGLLRKVRAGEDGRRVGLWPTPRTSRVLAGAPGAAEGILPTALSELSNQSLQILSAQLQRLIAALKTNRGKLSH